MNALVKTATNVSNLPTLIASTAGIDQEIDAISKRGDGLQTRIHIAALSVLVHAAKCGDITLMQKLHDKLPESFRRNALIKWFERFGCVEWVQDEKTKKQGFRFVKGKTTKLADANATPFWKLKASEGAPPLDLTNFCKSAISKLKADEKKTGANHSVLIAALSTAQINAGIAAVGATVN